MMVKYQIMKYNKMKKRKRKIKSPEKKGRRRIKMVVKEVKIMNIIIHMIARYHLYSNNHREFHQRLLSNL